MSISVAELQQLRGFAERELTDSCTILEPTAVTDAEGNRTDTYTAVDTVPCRLAPLAAQERLAGGERTMLGGWWITLPAGTRVSAQARIESAGRTFEVIGLSGSRSLEIVRRVMTQEWT